MGEPIRRRHEPRRSGDVLGALAAALLAFTAVPTVLVLVVGNPLGGGLGATWHPAWRAVLCVAAGAAWVAWAACCTQLARAIVVHVRNGGHVATPATVVDRLAARIALGVLAVSSVGGPLTLSASAGAVVVPVHPQPGTTLQTRPTAPPSDETRDGRPASPLAPALVPHGRYTVRQGDSLWSIAEELFQDGADWTAIASLNLGRDVGDGRRFVDPAHIEAGWRLRLPSGADAGRHDIVPTTVQALHRSAHPAAQPRPPRVTGGPSRSGAPGVPSVPSLPSHLPEIAALGLGSLVCAGLARRTWRRRPPPFTEDPDVARILSERAVDTAVLVHRFAGMPALTSFESANRLLGWALDGWSPAPVLRAATVTPRGVTFWPAAHALAAVPDGFVASDDGQGWHIGHDALAEVTARHPHRAAHSPFAPIALPVGDDDEGTWLLVLGPGQILPVLGADAAALVRAMRAGTDAWDWSDTIRVTDDPTDPTFSSDAAAGPMMAHHLVYVGHPASLPAALARRVATITTSAVPASDVTVLVDRHGATVHPLGRVVRPHLLSEETAGSVHELLSDVPVAGSAPPAGVPRVPHAGTGYAGPVQGTEAVTPGIVDVRLLTMTPRLDGLREELPPNRVRRTVELVAYLALHVPDVITSDRLRTRVLGSSDADAASKTLFNVAHAARRALGPDEHGAPLLPPGNRNGLYQISPAVTVDVARAAALAAEGRAYADDGDGDGDGERPNPTLAIAHFRAALDLVEGEPLANVLSGYTWWEAEGHGARLSAALVDAACTMAALTAEREQFALARWGLERARLVAPYSEALSRAAMQLAAAEGDTDRLQQEWEECQRRVDELDPGSAPSPRTESLYGDLRHLVHTGHGSPATGGPRPGLASPTYVPATSERAPTSAP